MQEEKITMKYYEIVLIVHPDKSDKVQHIINEYKKFVNLKNGIVYRCEDWGRRQLAYRIKKLQKAHYVLINIEILPDKIKEVKKKLQFDENIIRYLIMLIKNKVIESSIMLNIKREAKENRSSV